MATAVEKAIDVAEDVSEESAQIAEVMREWNGRDVGLGITFGLGTGIAVGAFGGFFLLSKRLKTKYEAIAEEEIATMKTYYDRKLRAVENREEKAQIEEVTKDIQTRTEGGGVVPYHNMYQGGSEPDKIGSEGEDDSVQNVFTNNGSEDPEVDMSDAWDIETELAKRDPTVPYVVHRSEHEEGPEGPEEYEKYTLTYFEGDDTLAREDDTVIVDQNEVIGLFNLSLFGHGSGDPNIVYIRNDKMKVDLEVVHSDGKYATEVAGFKEDELQHGSSMRRRSPRRSELDADR